MDSDLTKFAHLFRIVSYTIHVIRPTYHISAIKKFKEQMNNKFEISDLGTLSYYLGIELEQGVDYIELKQTAYAIRILEKECMAECNPTKYHIDPNEYINKDEGGKPIKSIEYKSMVGGL